MSNHPFDGYDDLGLADELTRQVSDLDAGSLTVGDVHGRARRIQRNRRLAVAAGTAAAVVALAVPAAVWGPSVLRSSEERPPIGRSDTPAPDVSPSDPSGAADGTAAPVREWLVTGLESGAPPAVPYVDHDTLVQAPGQEIALDPGTEAVARFPDGRVVVDLVDTQTGDHTLQVRSPDWELLGEYQTRNSFVSGGPGDSVAWVDDSMAVWVLDPGAAEPRRLAQYDSVDLLAAAVAGDCSDLCRVAVQESTDRSGGTRLSLLDQTGASSTVSGSFLAAGDVSVSGELIGQTESTDTGSCSEYTSAAADRGWGTCDHLLRGFSPDGSLIWASDAYGDGWGSGELAVYDTASGKPVLDLLRSGRKFLGYQQAVWEDDSHLLVTTYSHGEWAIVRVGLDGSQEYAVPPVAGEDVDFPLRLMG